MRTLGLIFRCCVLSIGLAVIRPEEIEELMAQSQQPKIAHVIPVQRPGLAELLRRLLSRR